MNDAELEHLLRVEFSKNFELYAEHFLRIKTKRAVGLQPFLFNRAQKYAHVKLEQQLKEKYKIRALVLKGRQQGVSTYVGGRFFHKVVHSFGANCFVMSHHGDTTNVLFDLSKRFYDNLSPFMQPNIKANNSKKLIFNELDSGYSVGTAGYAAVGRGNTIHFLHGSEVAFWDNCDQITAGLIECVPPSNGSEIILESTANGENNYFHNMWRNAEAGLSEYLPVFIPWYWQDEYKAIVDNDFELTTEETELKRIYALTDEQLQWRRYKIAEKSTGGHNGEIIFKQEYPFNSVEAFQQSGEDRFIPANIVLDARNAQNIIRVGAKIMGVDPARGGDRTAIIRRQGREAYDPYTTKTTNLMDIVGYCVRAIKEEKPDRIFIDIGGLGAGVYDRLIELGYNEIVKPVNFGTSAMDSERYKNTRAELWGLMKEWLQSSPVKIPDHDELHADLCSVGCKYVAAALLLESKDNMRSRNKRSPDIADALALTFTPFNINKTNNDRARHIMSKYIQSNALRQSHYAR